MSLELSKKVYEYLHSNPDEKFTSREIANWVLKEFPDECEEKRVRSIAVISPLDDNDALIQQLVREISSQRPRIQKQYPNIKITEGRPRKYYFTDKSDGEEIGETETVPEKLGNGSVFRESDLYPILSEFLWSELTIYSKRIDEKRSSNSRGRGGNHWLYPDVVGMEDLSATWSDEVKSCAGVYNTEKTKLWSFEVKLLVNRSNIREVYFQAVSNSSWANIAYLVASEIEGTDTLFELRMLAGLYGVGFIQLEKDNPSESQIIIPAKERTNVDWNIASRLTEENTDFVEFIKLVRQFYQTGDIRQDNWDTW